MQITDFDSFYPVIRHMEDEEIYSFFHSIYMANVLSIIAITTGCLALREYLAFLGAEYRTWKLLFQGRILPARLAIIIVRYAYIGAFISAVYFLMGTPKPGSCQKIYRLVFILYTILWAAAGSIFLMRLNIIFSRQRLVMSLFFLLWAGCIGLWAFVTSQLNAYPVPKQFQFPFGPTCATNRFPKISAVAWSGSIMFDSVVFIATFIRFRSVVKSKGKGKIHLRSRTWIFRSSLYYFAASFFFNMGMLISALTVNDPALSNCGIALAFSIHCVVATRLVFNTKGWNQNGSMEEDADVMLNTFNKNRRDAMSNLHPTASRITYTVDETVVTSIVERENEATEDAEDEMTEIRDELRGRQDKKNLFRSTNHQMSIADVEAASKDDRSSTRRFHQGRPRRIRVCPPSTTGQNSSLPKISTARAGSIQQKGMIARESIESLETKMSSKDDFAVRRRFEQVIPLPASLHRPEQTARRQSILLQGGTSKALLDIADNCGGGGKSVEETHTTINEEPAQQQQQESSSSSSTSDQAASSSVKRTLIESAASTNSAANLTIPPSTPAGGTLSSPPSYSVMDRLAPSPECPSTFSNNSPSLPSSYEIQQYQDYLYSVSRDENGPSSK